MDENVEEVLSGLLAIEERCAEVTRGIGGEAAALNARVEAERTRLNKETDERIAAEIRIMNEAAIESARAEMLDAGARSQNMFAAMEREYDVRGEEWVRELFEEIVGA